MILLGAKQDAQGWVVVFCRLIFAVPVDVGIELSEMLMIKPIYFQLNKHMALQNPVVED